MGSVEGVLDGSGDRRKGRGTFGGEFETFHCIQWARCNAALPKLLWAGLVVKGKGLLKVTCSHVHWKSDNVSETVLDRDVTGSDTRMQPV